MKTKPRTFYLTEFPKQYNHRRWFGASAKKRAEAYAGHVYNFYRVQGKVVKVKECK